MSTEATLWTGPEAARAVGVGANVLANWVRRGLLRPAATADGARLLTEGRHPLYWPAHVRAAEAATRVAARREAAPLAPEDGGEDLTTALWTTDVAAARAGVSANVVRNWQYRGLLSPNRITPEGRPLYRALDVVRAEAASRRRARRSYRQQP